MPRTDLLLYLDLECTGDEDDDDIVEIGLVMLDAKTLDEVGSYTSLVDPTYDNWVRMEANHVVVNIHQTSGLWADLLDRHLARLRGNHYNPDDSWLHSSVVDEQIRSWLKTFTGGDRTHIPYGGSGVSHFDRKFIKRHLPKLDRAITHYAIDIGPSRRIYEMAGRDWAPAYAAKTHRALDDARAHAEELRFVMRDIGWKRP